MAKLSMIEREKKREKLVKRYANKRAELKESLRKAYLSGDKDAVMTLQLKLQAMPVNSSRSRLQRRCQITGRPRGVYRKFGLGRNMLRLYAMMGLIPGLKKASW